MAIRVAVVTCVLAPAADGHWKRPEDVIARIASPPSRETLGVVTATRDPRLPRLLIVRVGAPWAEVDAARRRDVAEEWWTAWRHVVPQGILAILEEGSDRPLVNFGVSGRTVVQDVPATQAPGDAR
jgi:hypothetical protein